MFISASTDVKFHSWPRVDYEYDAAYTSNNNSRVIHASWCNDNNYLAILPEKCKPEIISTRNRHCVKLVHTVQVVNDVTAVAFQKTTKKCLGLGTAHGEVTIYDTKHRTISRIYTNLSGEVKFLDFDREDKCMAVACDSGAITVHRTTAEDMGKTFDLPGSSEPTVMRFHPDDGSCLASATTAGEVVVWDVLAAKKTFCVQSHISPVTGLAMSSSGGLLVSVGQDHKMCVYDLGISECLFRNNLQQPLSCVDLHFGGRLLAVGQDDGKLLLYDMRKMIQPVHIYNEHTARINKVLFENQLGDACELFDETSSKISDSINSHSSHSSGSQTPDSREAPKRTSRATLDPLMYQKLRKEMMMSLQSHVYDLSNKMTEHFSLFKNFIDNEFRALEGALEDKCDILKLANLEDSGLEVVKIHSQ